MMTENASNPKRFPECVRCRVEMKPLMRMPVRVGGTTGFFANWAEMSEQILTFDTFRCPQCRQVEFFDLDESLPRE